MGGVGREIWSGTLRGYLGYGNMGIRSRTGWVRWWGRVVMRLFGLVRLRKNVDDHNDVGCEEMQGSPRWASARLAAACCRGSRLVRFAKTGIHICIWQVEVLIELGKSLFFMPLPLISVTLIV